MFERYTTAQLATACDKIADVNDMTARKNAGAVDPTSAIRHVDGTISPGVQQIVSRADNIAGSSIEKALRGCRGRMIDGKSMLTDFNRILNSKKDMNDAVETAKRAGQGSRA